MFSMCVAGVCVFIQTFTFQLNKTLASNKKKNLSPDI